MEEYDRNYIIMKEINENYRNIILDILKNSGDDMLYNLPLRNINADIRKNITIPMEYNKELKQHVLMLNLKREAILSYVLLAIDIFLLCLDLFSTSMWGQNVHIFNYFSKLHVILIIIPSTFLILIYSKRLNALVCTKLHRAMHLLINTLVLVLCALISISNASIDRLAYPFIIAMFCIGSTILLNKKERIVMYTASYAVYLIGCTVIKDDIYHLIRNVFFITILVAIAYVVSYVHYTSYVNDFINHKTILDKNKELDKLYRESEKALQKRTEELNETVEYDKLRAAFFANISHELRTPLTVIFSAEQMLDLYLKKGDFEESRKNVEQYMELIKQNCYRLIRLVANLIDITKIDAGYLQVELKNCDIVKVVEDITLSVAKFVEDREKSLVFDTEVEELTIACDPDKIERIMLNLLSNAVKFTPKGGCIKVDICETEDKVRIHVKDSGIGIPEDMRKSIFERFIQVDKTTSRNHEGSGIGLSIVKSLVDMHHGTIDLISKEGTGSEFIVELPKLTVHNEESWEKPIEENSFVNEKQDVEKINIEFSDIYK